MNSSLHKRPTLTSGIASKATGKSNLKPDQLENLSTIDIEKENRLSIDIEKENRLSIDIEKENRLSKIISLLSKGLTQSEIAQELDVD
jgi:DNA-binding NarL/FixJ family response regulator